MRSSFSPSERKESMSWHASLLEKQAGGFGARFLFGRVFLIFGFLWASAFWPALHDAWWYADDFWMGEWQALVLTNFEKPIRSCLKRRKLVKPRARADLSCGCQFVLPELQPKSSIRECSFAPTSSLLRLIPLRA